MSYVLFALVQGVLVVAQADLLSRVLAGGTALLPLAAVLAGRAALVAGQETAFRRTAARRKHELRARLLRHLAVADGAAAAAGGPRRGPGADVTLLGRGLDALDPYFAGYLPQRYAAAVVPMAVLARLAVADWPSALVIAVTLPLIPVFGALVGWKTREATERQWGLLHRLGGHFLDVVAGLPTLRAYGRDAAQTEVVRAMADGHRRATVRTLRIAFLSSFVLEIVGTLSVALVAVPAGLRLLDGSLDLRTALLVLLLAPEAYLPLRLLGTRFHAAAEGRAVLEQVNTALAEPVPSRGTVPGPGARVDGRSPARRAGVHPDRRRSVAAGKDVPVPSSSRGAVSGPRRSAARASAAPGRSRGRSRAGTGAAARTDASPHEGGAAAARIEVDGVVVRHPGAAGPALDGFSLTVEPGERVALTGPSGAGKSTLLRTVLGFVAPDDGRVLVDGVDLAELDLAAWRRRVAYVPQRPHLFAGSVADNIRLGRPDADDDAVRTAAEAARAHEFVVALPGGYDARLGERGLGLSTGQRQRIAIARAYLMDAPIVLLDEPTARLDLAGEAAVVEAAGRLLAGRTALLVAHRPALLSLAGRTVPLAPRKVCA